MTLMRAVLVALAVLAAPAGHAIAQDYPTRPVTIVLPYTAGGAVEAVARLLGERLAQRLGRPFVIENRPGAGTGIAASYVAHAAPDGHTLLLATSTTMAINVGVYRNLTYDPVKDLAPVALVAGVSFVLVVNPSLGIHSMADFIRVAKSTPGGLAYASFGHGSAAHLYAEMLKTMTGIEGTHIPYKGSPPALNDIVGGHVPWMFGDFATAMPLVRAGKLVALGTSTAARVAAAPDVPPVADAVPGYDASAWQMIVAPAGTPDAIVGKIHREVAAIYADPAIMARLETAGLFAVSSTPEEFRAFIRQETERWSRVIKDNPGLKAD